MDGWILKYTVSVCILSVYAFRVGGLSDSSAAGLSPLAMFTDLVFLCERFANLEAQL